MSMAEAKERIEVAESIREYAKESDESAYEFIRGYRPADLAGMIDPTCHLLARDGQHRPPYVCSRCRCVIDHSGANYCPHCGCRIVLVWGEA